MQRKTTTIPKATVTRILMNAGAKRVSGPAANALSEIVKEISLKISSRAVDLAKHSGRKTVNAEDIKLAAKE